MLAGKAKSQPDPVLFLYTVPHDQASVSIDFGDMIIEHWSLKIPLSSQD